MTDVRFRISKADIYQAVFYVLIILLFITSNFISLLTLTNTAWKVGCLIMLVLSSITAPLAVTLLLIKIDDYKKAVQKLKKVEEMKEGIPDGTDYA